MVHKEQIILEVQGDWIFIKQGKHCVVIQWDNLTTDAKLPRPEEVRAKLKLAGICGNNCTVILSRLYWTVDTGCYLAMSRRELKSAQFLAEEVVASDWTEPVYTSTYVKKTKQENIIYAVAIPQTVIDEFTAWLYECGLKVKDFWLSAAAGVNRSKNSCPTMLIAGYPNGRSEISWINNGYLRDTYTLKTSDVTEFSKVLALMTVRSLSHSSIDQWDALPDEIEIDCSKLTVNIAISGNFDYDYASGLSVWANMLTNLGVKVVYQVDEVSGYECALGKRNILWPIFAISGVIHRDNSIKLRPKRTRKINRYPGIISGLILFLIIGMLLVVRYEHLLTARYNLLSTEWSKMQVPTQKVIAKRELNNQLEQTIEIISNKIATSGDFITTLTMLDRSLPTGSSLENCVISSGKIDLIIQTPSAPKALSALQQQVNVSSVAFTTPITSNTKDGVRYEKVGINLELATNSEVSIR